MISSEANVQIKGLSNGESDDASLDASFASFGEDDDGFGVISHSATMTNTNSPESRSGDILGTVSSGSPAPEQALMTPRRTARMMMASPNKMTKTPNKIMAARAVKTPVSGVGKGMGRFMKRGGRAVDRTVSEDNFGVHNDWNNSFDDSFSGEFKVDGANGDHAADGFVAVTKPSSLSAHASISLGTASTATASSSTTAEEKDAITTVENRRCKSMTSVDVKQPVKSQVSSQTLDWFAGAAIKKSGSGSDNKKEKDFFDLNESMHEIDMDDQHDPLSLKGGPAPAGGGAAAEGLPLPKPLSEGQSMDRSHRGTSRGGKSGDMDGSRRGSPRKSRNGTSGGVNGKDGDMDSSRRGSPRKESNKGGSTKDGDMDSSRRGSPRKEGSSSREKAKIRDEDNLDQSRRGGTRSSKSSGKPSSSKEKAESGSSGKDSALEDMDQSRRGGGSGRSSSSKEKDGSTPSSPSKRSHRRRSSNSDVVDEAATSVDKDSTMDESRRGRARSSGKNASGEADIDESRRGRARSTKKASSTKESEEEDANAAATDSHESDSGSGSEDGDDKRPARRARRRVSVAGRAAGSNKSSATGADESEKAETDDINEGVKGNHNRRASTGVCVPMDRSQRGESRRSSLGAIRPGAHTAAAAGADRDRSRSRSRRSSMRGSHTAMIQKSMLGANHDSEDENEEDIEAMFKSAHDEERRRILDRSRQGSIRSIHLSGDAEPNKIHDIPLEEIKKKAAKRASCGYLPTSLNTDSNKNALANKEAGSGSLDLLLSKESMGKKATKGSSASVHGDGYNPASFESYISSSASCAGDFASHQGSDDEKTNKSKQRRGSTRPKKTELSSTLDGIMADARRTRKSAAGGGLKASHSDLSPRSQRAQLNSSITNRSTHKTMTTDTGGIVMPLAEEKKKNGFTAIFNRKGNSAVKL